MFESMSFNMYKAHITSREEEYNRNNVVVVVVESNMASLQKIQQHAEERRNFPNLFFIIYFI